MTARTPLQAFSTHQGGCHKCSVAKIVAECCDAGFALATLFGKEHHECTVQLLREAQEEADEQPARALENMRDNLHRERPKLTGQQQTAAILEILAENLIGRGLDGAAPADARSVVVVGTLGSLAGSLRNCDHCNNIEDEPRTYRAGSSLCDQCLEEWDKRQHDPSLQIATTTREWTRLTFRCEACADLCYASREEIDNSRTHTKEKTTDEEIVNLFNRCLRCAEGEVYAGEVAHKWDGRSYD